MTIEVVMKSLETIERNLLAASERAEKQAKETGQVSTELKLEIEEFGNKQRELADRILGLEQKGIVVPEQKLSVGWGDQLVKSDRYQAFAAGQSQKVRIEVKNTLVGADANVAPDRKPGIVPGASVALTLEGLYTHVPTASNAIEFTKEASFTNSAAEASEGAAKAESALTWSLVNMPISTVAHWIKISRQLAADNAALAAYVNARMVYGVNRRVETQLGAGDGVAPNISGILDAGNFTAHGYADAALAAISTTLKKVVLIRKMIADLWVAGYPATAILLNPADWATIELELLTVTSNAVRVGVNGAGQQTLFGVPVIQSVGITADNVVVGNFMMHGTIYDREAVVVELSDSDSDNFTKNLVTVRAERRLALATEVPAAVRAGDLTPA